MHINLRKLRVKIKHLALEPAIIKREEHQVLREGKLFHYQSLYHHRIGSLRRESRATQLVYAMLRGKSYTKTETNAPMANELWNDTTLRVMDRMAAMIDAYGDELVDKLPESAKTEIRKQDWKDRITTRRRLIKTWIIEPWIMKDASTEKQAA